MLIRRRRSWEIAESDVTPEPLFRDRRRFMQQAAGAMAGVSAIGAGLWPGKAQALLKAEGGEALEPVVESRFSTDEPVNTFDQVSTYNNFYEFGTGKGDPADNAHSLKTRPWTVQVDGMVGKPGTLDIEALLKDFTLEERIYRLRCVEAWSMVVPWVGIPLKAVLDRFEPLGSARYVQFQTLYDPSQMPGQRSAVLPWPYIEGLRLDEAMNPLTLLAVGLYGRTLPNQNGAPVRLVVPWKYGFKSIKSVVRMTLTEEQPVNTWNRIAAREYGFYANVNPTVDHPRWSQGSERRIGDFFKRDTLMFNGYADEVAHLYTGMDLDKFY